MLRSLRVLDLGTCLRMHCLNALPAFVGSFGGEFVAAAAVWGVAKRSIRGGGARSGPHRTSTGPTGLLKPVGGFVGTTLTREVVAHPFHHLLHNFIFKLGLKHIV